MASRQPVFLDASVVMYTAGGAHPLREPCRRALRRAVDEDLPLVTSSEVLQEVLHRYVSIGRPDDAETVFHAVQDLCSEIVPVTEADAERALALLLDAEGLSPRDAIHLAVMEHHDLRRILSTDRDFDAIDGVERVDPTVWAE